MTSSPALSALVSFPSMHLSRAHVPLLLATLYLAPSSLQHNRVYYGNDISIERDMRQLAFHKMVCLDRKLVFFIYMSQYNSQSFFGFELSISFEFF